MEPLRGQVRGHGDAARYELHDYTTFGRGPDSNPRDRSNFADEDYGIDADAHNSHSGHASQQKLPLVGATSTDNLSKAGVEPTTNVLWNGLPHFLLSWDLVGVALSICFLGKLSLVGMVIEKRLMIISVRNLRSRIKRQRRE